MSAALAEQQVALKILGAKSTINAKCNNIRRADSNKKM
jgi:hypothetical protein